MPERLKIEGNFMIIFEDGNTSLEYVNEQRSKITPKYDDNNHVRFFVNGQLIGDDKVSFDCSTIIDDTTGAAFTSIASLKTFLSQKLGTILTTSVDYSDLFGVFQLTGDIKIFNVNSNKNNVNVDGYNVVTLTANAHDRIISGVVAPPQGENRVLIFLNESIYRIKFAHQSGNSTNINRIVLRNSSTTRILYPYQMAIFTYNHSLNRWHVSRIN